MTFYTKTLKISQSIIQKKFVRFLTGHILIVEKDFQVRPPDRIIRAGFSTGHISESGGEVSCFVVK